MTMTLSSKRQKTSNFSSAGRMLGTGDVKETRKKKKEHIKDDDADYVPEPNSQPEPGTVTNGVLAGKKRKRSSEVDEDVNAVSESSVPILRKTNQRKLRSGKAVKALEAARTRLAEQYKTKTKKAEVHETPHVEAQAEAESDTLQKQAEKGNGVTGNVEGALRGGRNRDAFVNKYGKGHSL